MENLPSTAVIAGMNECLKLGSGEGRANVRLWVLPEEVIAAARDQLKTLSVVDVSGGFC